MVAKDYRPLKRAFNRYFKGEWVEDDRLIKNITVKTKGKYFLYNYGGHVLVKRNHPVLMRCRGIIINGYGNIINYPFDRFFNYFEKEVSSVNWDEAEIQEKVDGSLICVWFDDVWRATTRGSFYPNDYGGINFADLFRKHFNKFDELKKGICYMFELVTKDNMIVTHYNGEFVVLLGARELKGFKELSQKALDKLAIKLGVKRPKRFDAGNVDECKRLFDDLRDDEEGLVVVDNKFNRVKIKQRTYIQLSRIKMLKGQDLFRYVLGQIILDAEYFHYCPEVKEEIDRISGIWCNVLAKIRDVFDSIKVNDRKEFALKAIKYPFKSILFAMYDNKNINDSRIDYDSVKEWEKELDDND